MMLPPLQCDSAAAAAAVQEPADLQQNARSKSLMLLSCMEFGLVFHSSIVSVLTYRPLRLFAT